MKLLLKLSGFDNYEKEFVVEWTGEVTEFHRFASYDNRYWGWIFYDKDSSGKADYALLYSEHKKEALPIDMHGRPFPVTDWNWLLSNQNGAVEFKECECGQKGIVWAKHSTWCPKWTN